MGDVIRGRVNWDLLRALNEADDQTKHFMGTMRCVECEDEDKLLVPAPAWAITPPPVRCERDGCLGMMLFVDPAEPPPEGAEPYEYVVVSPEDPPGDPD